MRLYACLALRYTHTHTHKIRLHKMLVGVYHHYGVGVVTCNYIIIYNALNDYNNACVVV